MNLNQNNLNKMNYKVVLPCLLGEKESLRLWKKIIKNPGFLGGFTDWFKQTDENVELFTLEEMYR